MTTNQTIDGVLASRELLESFAAYVSDSPNAIMRARAKELRALLDAPVCGTPSGDKCTGDGVGRCKKCPAAQHQGEPVAILSGPDDSVCWTQDSTPKALRKQVVLIDHSDFLRLQELAYGAAGRVYQTRWNRLGEWEEWKTVSLEQYQRSEGMLFERRIIYAEQPAPVAAPLNHVHDGGNDQRCDQRGDPTHAADGYQSAGDGGGEVVRIEYSALDPVERLAACRGEQPELRTPKCTGSISDFTTFEEARGWNACLDELKRLNPTL